MHRELISQGTQCCENTVAKLMREHQIQARNKPKFRVSHSSPIKTNQDRLCYCFANSTRILNISEILFSSATSNGSISTMVDSSKFAASTLIDWLCRPESTSQFSSNISLDMNFRIPDSWYFITMIDGWFSLLWTQFAKPTSWLIASFLSASRFKITSSNVCFESFSSSFWKNGPVSYTHLTLPTIYSV